MFFMYPYNTYSEGAKLLAQKMDILRIRRERSRFVCNRNKTVINWGNNYISNPEILKCKILNRPNLVGLVSNKRSFFHQCNTLNIHYVPESTTNMEIALRWAREGRTVVCRTLLSASEGRGIVIARTPQEVVVAPLYTVYHNKTMEFRINVLRDNVVDVRQKVARRGQEINNWQVRNTANGFTFQRTHAMERCPAQAKAYAIDIVRRFGLDFGGVDVIVHEPTNTIKVLEVNTAPGLDDTSATLYAQVFNSL